MLLAIDVGNTRIKAAVFEQDKLIKQFAAGQKQAHDLLTDILSNYKTIEKVVGISVSGELEIPGALEISWFNRSWNLPFKNLYSTPETLGLDRMLLAAGAVVKYPKANRLVIDAGTCVTYDFIDSDDRYHGGAISPGLAMRYRALHDYTAKLPALKPSFPLHPVGASTAESMHAGVVNGLLHEITGTIAEYQKNRPNFIIILTGGDIDFLAGQLKYTIFANPNFLLESLNLIFQHKALQ